MAAQAPNLPVLKPVVKRRRLPATLGPLAVLVVIVAGMTALNPLFLSTVNLQNLARQASILAILAIGETFIILLGSIDLSIEGNMAISSVIIGLLAANYFNENDFGMLAVILAIVAATVFGFTCGMLHTRLRIPAFMATLGMLYVGMGIGTYMAKGMNLPLQDPMILSWARGTTFSIPNLLFFGIGMSALGLVLERYTRFGRYVMAIGGAEDRAKLAGVPINRYKVMAFTIAGFFYGVGGVLNTARMGAGAAQAGALMLFAAITAVAVGGTALTGGRGGVVQSIIGALIVTAISNGMILAGVPSIALVAVQGTIITVAVILTLDRSKLPYVK
jgi:ribose transport system permease protein